MPQRRRVSDWGLGELVASVWGMPRLALDLPDELGRVESSRENGENRVAEDPVGTRATTANGADADNATIARWHRCWAGSGNQ